MFLEETARKDTERDVESILERGRIALHAVLE
ncbi:MAG: hypothetical protein ACI9UK_001061 [Candidatus Krumholzibacteriia bacterium]|jgi:hypothetical protein